MDPLDKLVRGFSQFKQRYYIAEPKLYEALVDRGTDTEYGVKHLEVENIIVFGHGQCDDTKSLKRGGVGLEKGSFINPWMSTAMPAR